MISVDTLNYLDPIVANDKQKQGKAPARADAKPAVTAKPIQLTLSSGWAVAVILILLAGLGTIAYAFFQYVWKDLNAKLDAGTTQVSKLHDSLDTITRTLQDHRVSIGQIEKGLSSIEQRMLNLDRPRYESKAKAAGFKNPQLVATRFAGNETVEPRTVLQKGENLIQYTILKYNRSTNELSIRFDARIGTNRFDGNILIVEVAPGQAKEVSFIRGKGIPRIFVQVLDLPSPDSAILAIGPKTDPADKTS